MLYEIIGVKSYINEPHRKWYFDQHIDLTVWFDETDQIIGWQLVYDKNYNPQALTWTIKTGYKHFNNDGKPDNPLKYNMGSIIKGIKIDLEKLRTQFKQKSQNIDKRISGFIDFCLKESLRDNFKICNLELTA